MIAALLSFLGGNVFRLIFGELTAYLNGRQDHTHEIERMRVQEELDAAKYLRMQESLRLQAELGIHTVQVQSEAVLDELEGEARLEATKSVGRKTGIWFLDAWNGTIRPLVATWAIVMVTANFAQHGWSLDDNGWALCGAALGIYLADRSLFKRGK